MTTIWESWALLSNVLISWEEYLIVLFNKLLCYRTTCTTDTNVHVHVHVYIMLLHIKLPFKSRKLILISRLFYKLTKTYAVKIGA